MPSICEATTPQSRWPRFLPVAMALALACCNGSAAGPSSGPSSSIEEDLAAPRQIFAAAPTVEASVIPPPAAPAIVPSSEPSRIGIAGIAQSGDMQGSARRGRDFAFDNCRPCHVVAPDQKSTTRFSNAPDFQSVANMPSTTPLSLMVWLTNPHPTMPSLVLSPQEASDVIAYIQSLRSGR